MKVVEALALVADDVPDHPAEHVLGIFLQRRCDTARGDRTAQSNDRSRRDGAFSVSVVGNSLRIKNKKLL